MCNLQSIDIRPGVRILSILSRINYTPWFALAEFVDNSIQSFHDYREQIEHVDGDNAGLEVEILLDPTEGGCLIIRDNAAGIHEADYSRAFRPAEIPIDTSGLSEFGMGMKSAACWFAPSWMVRTTALGEPVERTVNFDISEIVDDNLEELDVETKPIDADTHFTEIVLSNLHRPPKARTISKMREHLESIYRVFLREHQLKLKFRDQVLSYPEPEILCAPFFKTETGARKLWRKTLDFDFGTGLRVRGYAALREKASPTRAGFSLFRRNRLIQGSGDECYRPKIIFGRPNDFTYQRLFGELHLEGFDVSHTKDGFQWDENEEPFLELLKVELNKDPIPLLSQAEGYRANLKTPDLKKGAEISTQRTAKTVQKEIPPVVEDQLREGPDNTPPRSDLPPTEEPVANRTVSLEIAGQQWQITIELSNNPSVGDWLSVSDYHWHETVRRVKIRVSLAHPFMRQYGGTDTSEIEPLQRMAVAIALAEITSRESGIEMAGTFRRNINKLLREALWKS